MNKPQRTEESLCVYGVSQCSNGHDFEVFSSALLEQATSMVSTMVEGCTAFIDESENSQDDDMPNHLKAMRRSYSSSARSLDTLQACMMSMCDRTIQLAERLERFKNHISRTALTYGLNLLPDGLLAKIFALAATTLEEKVALSFVCKRFRRVMMMTREMWDGYHLETDQTPEEIAAIAEGNGFVSLKARINSAYIGPDLTKPSFLAIQVNPDSQERNTAIQIFKFTLRIILHLGPEELEFPSWGESVFEEIEPILASGNLQNLRRLAVIQGPRRSSNVHIIEGWHMPLLQNLEVDFVPGTAIAGNLVRLRMMEIKETDLDFLREFLTVAKSLQDLHLFLEDNHNGNRATPVAFYEDCDLPSLQELETNFVPHPSLAKHLLRFRLHSFPWRRISLTELLDFLSSSNVIRKLTICLDHNCRIDPEAISSLRTVIVSSVVDCEISDSPSSLLGPVLITKLHMPTLRTLKLGPDSLLNGSPTTRKEFRISLRSMASLEKLELKGTALSAGVFDEIIRFAPQHLESLSLKHFQQFHAGPSHFETSLAPSPGRRLLRFAKCSCIPPDFVLSVVDYLKAVELHMMQIEFANCQGWRNGTFGLDDVMSAWVRI